MPRVRVEWMPVQTFGLGHLGFDHLQLVFEPGEGASWQDDWFVMEGVRDTTDLGTFLGIEGADGRTTLSIANVAARGELTDKIGTPELRGSRALPYHGDEFRAWETMSSYAQDIEAEDYPYIAYGLPGSPTPTINSSSAVASLIHYSGLDPTQSLPYGMRLSPGTSTLLGTGGAERMRIEHGFTTLLGGGGDDLLIGGGARQIEKFYGGEGDDMFRWSPGFNIVHGGQPQLAYAADGTDVIDYSGAGEVTITFNRHWVPHRSPNFFAVNEDGTDHLFSVERIQWNAKSDRIELGKDINLLEDDRVLQPHADLGGPETRRATIIAEDAAVIGDAASGTDGSDRLIGTDAAEVIDGKGGDDTLYGGEGDDTLIGGKGSDGYVYLVGDGDDVVIDLPGDAGIDELVLTGGIAAEDVAIARVGEHDLLLSVPRGSILVSGFFAAPDAGIERIIFDDAPPLMRSELELLAGDMPGGPGAGDALPLPVLEVGNAGMVATDPDCLHAPHTLVLF
ncbi:MAG: calcium-binding protein [Hyphomicrobium sp.]